jgi:hypothetical protein
MAPSVFTDSAEPRNLHGNFSLPSDKLKRVSQLNSPGDALNEFAPPRTITAQTVSKDLGLWRGLKHCRLSSSPFANCTHSQFTWDYVGQPRLRNRLIIRHARPA